MDTWWYEDDSPHLDLTLGKNPIKKRHEVGGTGKAGENGQSSVWVAKLMLEQTVGCNTREGGCYWVNW